MDFTPWPLNYLPIPALTTLTSLENHWFAYRSIKIDLVCKHYRFIYLLLSMTHMSRNPVHNWKCDIPATEPITTGRCHKTKFHVVMYMECDYRWILDWLLNLLDPLTQHMSILYNSLLHTHTSVHSHVFSIPYLASASDSGHSPSPGFPNYPWLPVSHNNSSQQLNLSNSNDWTHSKVKDALWLTVYRQSAHLGLKRLETRNQRFFFSKWTLAVIVLWNIFSDEKMGFSYEYAWPFVKCMYRTYSMLSKIFPFALYTSSVSVQALQSRSCLPYVFYATTAG
jgi:hypothetical protein